MFQIGVSRKRKKVTQSRRVRKALTKRRLRMLGRKTFKIDGVEYVMEPYDFETDLMISSEALKTSLDVKAESVKADIDTTQMQVLSVLKSLASWTFRGFTAEKDLVVDEAVPILEVNEENLKKLPARHTSVLRRVAIDLNTMTAEEVKKLLDG